MIRLIDYLAAKPRIVRGTAYGIVIGVLILSFFADRHHAHTAVERNLPFFWSVFAFVAACAILFFAYWFGRSGILAREDYYEAAGEDAETD